MSTNICLIHQPQNANSLRDTGNNITHKVFEGELTVTLRAKDVKVGTRVDINHRYDQVTVLDLLTTKALVLLGFSIMHQ